VLVDRQRFCAAGDVLKPHWHEVPDIDADVDAISRSSPIVVDVPKDLEGIPASMVPGGVVAWITWRLERALHETDFRRFVQN
jgi:hypothetical protein